MFKIREDLALSEAELPLDEFMEKLEMKNWAREQVSLKIRVNLK